MRKVYSWVLFGALTACFVSCDSNVPVEKHTSFETLVVEKTDLTVQLKYSARMKGKMDVTITPQITGQLMQNLVHEGQQVKAGQVLFVIDDRQARLALADAEASLIAALAQEKSALLEYESNKNLFEKKIVSSYMLNTAENNYNQAKAAVAQARSLVNHAKVDLGYCTITSPVSGVIGNIPVTVGMQVSSMTELTTVSGNEKMDASFSITENDIAAIMQDANTDDFNEIIKCIPEVKFVMKNGKDYDHKGSITTVSGIVDSNTGSVTCTATFPNPEGKLISGIQGSVVIPYNVEKVIVVPQNAIVRLQDKSLVYKVGSDSCAVSAIITAVDAGNGKDAVVTSGLNPGDKIVTKGANNVMEGMKVLY